MTVLSDVSGKWFSWREMAPINTFTGSKRPLLIATEKHLSVHAEVLRLVTRKVEVGCKTSNSSSRQKVEERKFSQHNEDWKGGKRDQTQRDRNPGMAAWLQRSPVITEKCHRLSSYQESSGFEGGGKETISQYTNYDTVDTGQQRLLT
jgi:hypothetical protein